MIRTDLKNAGIPYKDEAERVFDFHATRHQYITGLVLGDAKPKQAQMLARHSSIKLTLDRYTHLDIEGAASALDALPDYTSPKPTADKQALQATGTDGRADPKSPGKSPRIGCNPLPRNADSCKTGDAKAGQGEAAKVLRFAANCNTLQSSAPSCNARGDGSGTSDYLEYDSAARRTSRGPQSARPARPAFTAAYLRRLVRRTTV
jgi:hypothetical protein